MAMALLDSGCPADRFRIDAYDISERSIDHARKAVFGRNSFRGGQFGFRDRHFTPAGSGWQLDGAVCNQVDFRHGNILDLPLKTVEQKYDAIFCRNLLIYFDRPTQDRAIMALTRLLSEKGWLFVGPSETGLLLSHAFVSAKKPLAFAFRPAGAVASAPRPREVEPPRHPPAPRLHAQPTAMPFSSVILRPPAVVPSPPEPLVDIDHTIKLADQGKFAEAEKECERHLETHGPSAKLFYVIGLVKDASGRPIEAAGYYRKAIYLDPRHRDALVHLAYLLEAQGDRAGARVMNDRARRIEQKAAN